jgi:glutamyl-tRNA reductase
MARIDDLSLRGGQAPTTPTLTLVGINHRSASMEELEEAALDETGVRRTLKSIVAHPRIAEAAVIATCNRTEAYLVAEESEGAAGIGRELLRSLGSVNEDAIFVKFGRDAIAHLCRVAAGIDSLMVGEVQILGQVKTAYTLASDEQSAGPLLGKLFGTAFRAGKRARTETQIGQGAVSVSYAALGLAQKIFTDLKHRTLLLVGAGETAALAGRHFAEAGVGSIIIANRTLERGERLALELGGRAIALADLGEALAQADVVVTATSAPIPVITREQVATAKHRRGNRPLVFIDIAMPRDVDPRVNDLDGVFVHDMGALESIVQKNLERRRREIPRVEAIVAEEVERHLGWEKGLESSATIRDLRAHFEHLRAEELLAVKSKLAPAEYEKLDRLTRSLMNKLLHEPMTRIRRPRPEAGNPVALNAAARELFALDGDSPSDDGGEDRPRRSGRGAETDEDSTPGDPWHGQ